MTNTIQNRCVLVDLTISRRTSVRADKQATETVRSQYQATGNVGTYGKKLFPQDPPELKTIGSVINEAMAMHRELTLPWMTGWRILPRELHDEYAQRVSALRRKLDDALLIFSRALPRLQDEARIMLGRLYRDEDYPTPGEFCDAHGIEVRFMPLPDSGDFRIDLDPQSLDEIRASYEADLRESLATAQRDAVERMGKALESLVGACNRVDAKVQEGAKLAVMREAVVTNIRDVLNIMPALNVANDPGIEAMRAEILRSLGGLDIAELREIPKARADARAKAEAILAKMSAFRVGGA